MSPGVLATTTTQEPPLLAAPTQPAGAPMDLDAPSEPTTEESPPLAAPTQPAGENMDLAAPSEPTTQEPPLLPAPTPTVVLAEGVDLPAGANMDLAASSEPTTQEPPVASAPGKVQLPQPTNLQASPPAPNSSDLHASSSAVMPPPPQPLDASAAPEEALPSEIKSFGYGAKVTVFGTVRKFTNTDFPHVIRGAFQDICGFDCDSHPEVVLNIF